MKVNVKLFAVARDLAGADQVDVRLDAPPTVAGLRRALAEQYPALLPILERTMIAVNSEYAPAEMSLAADSEVALIPPVSGG